MREILFRGKRLDNGEWVEGAFCPKNTENIFGPMVDKPSIIKLEPPYDGFWYDVAPDTVGQFTGLMDKNGKRIFEGDIAKIKGQGVYLCVWSKGNLEFSLTNVKESFGMAYLPMYNATVIGTIHDNPELLEVAPDE